MDLLLDTHILLWALSDNPQLSNKARELILNRKNRIFYSILSLWEIELKHINHPEQLTVNSKSIYEYCCSAGYQQLPLKNNAIFLLSTIKRPDNATSHKDPYDRMLLCQASSENMQFITHDVKLADYNIGNVILV